MFALIAGVLLAATMSPIVLVTFLRISANHVSVHEAVGMEPFPLVLALLGMVMIAWGYRKTMEIEWDKGRLRVHKWRATREYDLATAFKIYIAAPMPAVIRLELMAAGATRDLSLVSSLLPGRRRAEVLAENIRACSKSTPFDRSK